MNPLKTLLKINWSSSRLRVLDFLLAFCALGYGLYHGSEFLIWVGVSAVILSLINPMGRIQRGLKGFIRRKREG